MENSDVPIPSFHFSVVIGTENKESFSEVEGIGATMETEDIEEGGDNEAIRQMPKKVTNKPLVLKRPIAPKSSTLTSWCTDIFERGLAARIDTYPVHVALLDGSGTTVRQWTFTNAYPTAWSIETFSATKNEVAVEVFTLAYHSLKRVM